MSHGDPLLWWKLDPDSKTAALASLAADGLDYQEAERKRKKHKGPKSKGNWLGIRGLEKE